MDVLLKDFRYSVAIRTLGTAGDKYQQELDSLNKQTIKPEKIMVYLAEGYEKPKETIGWEKIVYVKKGMIAQRALQYEEIDSPYILMLDDDVYLPIDGVEKLAKGLLENNGDCISADTFPNQTSSAVSKIKDFITNWAIPIHSNKWATKIQHTGSSFYNNNPTKDVYLAQSAAGPCSLWKKTAFLNIHFEDELWLDRIGFAYGEDLLCYYKLHLNGGRLLFHYTSGAKHLDAKSSRSDYNSDPSKLRKRARAWFLLWWRIDFAVNNKSLLSKTISLCEYFVKFIWGLLTHIAYGIASLSFRPINCFILGNIDGYKYVHGEEYKKVPNFKILSKDSLLIFPNTNGFSKFIMSGLKRFGTNVIGFYRYDNSFVLNVLRILSMFEIGLPKRLVWGKWCNMTNYSSIILFAEVASKDVVETIEKNNPHARKIYYMWNIRNKVPDYIKSENGWELWSFDKNECDKFGWNYVNQFYPNFELSVQKQKYDFCFCGYNKGRKTTLEKLACLFHSKALTYKFIIREWGVKNWVTSIKHKVKGIIITPFETDYKDYLRLVGQSKCVVDLVWGNQIGLTMRVMESLFFRKKMITNNKDIVSYSFYSPENIFVLGIDDIDKLETWLNIPINTNFSVNDYTVENWYNTMGIK